MATYAELYTEATTNTALQNRVAVACVVAAEAIRTEAGTVSYHDGRLRWAARVLVSPQTEAARMLWAVLAANAGLTVAQIQAATDAALQTAVNNAVNLFATVT